MTNLDDDMRQWILEVKWAFEALRVTQKEVADDLRRRIEAQVLASPLVAEKKAHLAQKLQLAHKAGVPKVALKEVTTKDRHSFDALFTAPSPSDVIRPDYLKIELVEGMVCITLDALRMDPGSWSGEFLPNKEEDGEGVTWAQKDGGKAYPVAKWLSVKANSAHVEDWLEEHFRDA